MDIEVEVWKSIPSFEGYLEASSFGRIRTVDRWVNSKYGPNTVFVTGKIRSIHTNKSGYILLSSVKRNGVIYTNQYVHRLVAEAFLGKTQGLEVNHKDGNKSNNNVNNLEWVTASENQKHRFRINNTSKGSKNAAAVVDEHLVRKIRIQHREGMSISRLAREYNMSYGGMWDIVAKKNWKHVI